MNEYQEAYCALDKAYDTIIRDGFCVIPNILDHNEIRNARKGLWSTLEYLTKNLDIPIKEDNVNTWSTYYQMDSNRNLIIQNWKIGHSQFVWDIRQNPKVVNVFSNLWKVKAEDLLTSFDAISFHIPPEYTGKGFYQGDDWWHTDQSPNNNKFSCVQGMILLYDVNDGDATIRLKKGSNHLHETIFKNNKVRHNKNWYQYNKTDLEFLSNCESIRVSAKSGDIILWDSRTAHYGINPLAERKNPNVRANVYVCMMPRNLISNQNLLKKQYGFKNMEMTTHWPHQIKFFHKYTKKYDIIPNINDIPKPKLTYLGYKLAGF